MHCAHPLRASFLVAATAIFLACEQPQQCVDGDGDGIDSCSDCNDTDAAIKPGSAEVCGDQLDNNCVNGPDEGCGPSCDPPCPPDHVCTADSCQSCAASETNCADGIDND